MAAPGEGRLYACFYEAVTFIWPPVTAISGRHRRHSSGHPRIHSHGQGHGRWLSGEVATAPTTRTPAAAVGPNPTDRGKDGDKRHMLTDGRRRPLATIVTAANVI